MLFVWSTSAAQSSGSVALYGSPSTPEKAGTSAGFSAVMEVGSALQICLKAPCSETLTGVPVCELRFLVRRISLSAMTQKAT